jgi:hypothetical protein
MSSWCLTASDSAATASRPPGLASFARVTSKWAIKLNSKLIKANFNGLRTIHKSAFLRCILPKSAIRHTHLIVEPLSSDLEIDLAASVLDRVSELFCLTEDRAKNPELAAFRLVERRFTPPTR